jgi:integrase
MAKRKTMYQRPDGLFEKKISIDGKRIAFRGKTEREVMQKMVAYEAKKTEEAKGPTFKEVALEWWIDKEPRLSPNTVANYRTAYRAAVERFGDRCIKDIGAPEIKNWLTAMGRQGLAKKTVANYLIIVTGVLGWACENLGLSSNPATLVTLPDGLRQEKRAMPEEEELETIKEFRNDPDGMFFYLIMYTGLRRGEVLALQWKDIDADKNIIRVHQSLYWATHNAGQLKAPKTDAGNRVLPYLTRLREVLEPHRADPEHFVFGGEKPMSKHAYNYLLIRYTEKTDLEITPHQLRHAFATLCFEANLPEKTTQGLLGHAQLSTTMDIYTELRNKKLMVDTSILNQADY